MNTDSPCCNDYAEVSRRGALRTALGFTAGLATFALFGDAFVETSYAATGKADRMLVVLSLRGAADGLSLVVPHGDPVYYKARPTIAIPKSKLLAADSFFGLHPAFAPLLPLWNQGKMAAVHATGQIVTTRSHFAAMEEVEDADPGSRERSGWLNRLVGLRQGGVGSLTALQLTDPVLATQWAGTSPVLSANELKTLQLSGPDSEYRAPWEAALGAIWKNAPSSLAGGNRAIAIAKTLDPVQKAPASAVTYPPGDLGKALASTAQLLKSDVGAEVVTVDQGSWDHHQWVGTLDGGNLKTMADPLGAGLAAFFEDLGPLADRVTVVTISEFGRRVKENASQGLDHGHGNVMFVLGAGVKGGYYGRWPGIEGLEDSDLPVTTDYRDVLAEVTKTLYPERSLSAIFPQFNHTPIGFMAGVIPPSPPQDPPPASLKSQPAAFYKSWGKKQGKAKVGALVGAPLPLLTARGKAAGVRVSYQWELVKNGKIKKKNTGRKVRVPKLWAGHSLQVRVTAKAKGYKPLVKVFKWGKVKKK